jgi:murein DD-endopeptidase MepM/ murein hydrolase activator NlpD
MAGHFGGFEYMASGHGFGRAGRYHDPHAFHSGHTRTRDVRVRPLAFWSACLVMGLLLVWSGATAAYFAFRDDVLKRLVSRHTEMQFAYEDRIADMRAQIEKLTSRQLLDQEQIDTKLETIQKRQAALEARAGVIAQIAADPTQTGSTNRATSAGNRPVPLDATPPAPTLRPLKPAPISDTVPAFAPVEREMRADAGGMRLDTRAEQRLAQAIMDRFQAQRDVPREIRVTRVQDSLDKVEVQQAQALANLQAGFESRARQMRTVLTELGLDRARLPNPQGAMGGPFVAPPEGARAPAFERQVAQIRAARAHLDQLNQTLTFVPVRRPLDEEHEQTSGFGIRSDPFFGRPAMHTGLDFRGPVGEPVRVTAAGRVVTAGWSGGYGKMVEVDHGNGFSTRYAHLSDIDVEDGQMVRANQIVGKLGSTGRSTGPHLHYETRIDGEAVNPERFLRAGERLEDVLR